MNCLVSEWCHINKLTVFFSSIALYQLLNAKVRKMRDGENILSRYRTCFILLEELVILLVQADSVLTPELLRLVHRTPFQAAGLEFRAVLIKWAIDLKKIIIIIPIRTVQVSLLLFGLSRKEILVTSSDMKGTALGQEYPEDTHACNHCNSQNEYKYGLRKYIQAQH